LRVAFMGTPELAASVLRALCASRHPVVAVVSQPDRPAGRGRRSHTPPAAAFAKERGLPLLQPESVRTAGFRAWLAEHTPDIGVVAAFGHILGPRVLATPRLGCVNVHASLLPRWRGASPIQAAIDHGEAATGVSIMQMDEGLDTGPVYHMRAIPIGADETAAELHDRIAALGGEALVATLDAIAAGSARAVVQDDARATWAPLLSKGDGAIDWRAAAVAIARRVRAFWPWPGTFTDLGGATLKVLPPVEVLPHAHGAAPGTVLAATPDGVEVACGEGALRLRRLQLSGRGPLDVAEFLRGRSIAPGIRLGADASSQA